MQELVEKIRSEIRSRGPIPFHDFMQMALYCPVYGYYEKEADIIGRSGDFYTSVSVGPLFGQLLAFQFAEWLNCPEFATPVHLKGMAAVGSPPPPVEERAGERRPSNQIVEAGADDGTLAKDILTWIQQHRPALFERLEYWIIEPSAPRRTRQRQALASFQGKVHWLQSMLTVANHAPRSTFHAPHPISGVIFSNELLDAMPFHRLGWDAKSQRWFEWGVKWGADRFEWVPLADKRIDKVCVEIAPELLDLLPDGFTTEISSAASEWWHDAANSLQRGKLVAIDYGLEADEFFHPERASGTARGYRRHHVMSDLLADPGEQDITAHVNFSQLMEVGELCGLKTELLESQARFLTRIFANASATPDRFGEWTRKHTRQFQTLTHPEQFGRAFRILVQQRT